MSGMFKFLTALLVLIPIGFAGGTAHAEKRIALVIGNAGYQTGALNTPANDAGLVAQTLQASGFDVVGARDLDQDCCGALSVTSSTRLRGRTRSRSSISAAMACSSKAKIISSPSMPRLPAIRMCRSKRCACRTIRGRWLPWV